MWLERKLEAIPRLVQGHRLLSKLLNRYSRGQISRGQLEKALQGLHKAFPELLEFPFPKGYIVSSEENERAKVLCELSRARWEFLAFVRRGTIPGRPRKTITEKITATLFGSSKEELQINGVVIS